MKILWITNIMMPPLCKELKKPVPAIGGWMYSSLKRLQDSGAGEIAVATVYAGKKMITRKIEGISYYLLPMHGKSMLEYNTGLELYWKAVKGEFEPDVVHIHGSEYPHGLAYVRSCGNKGVVVSIQGMLSVYARYYTAGIGIDELKGLTTFRDIIKRDGILRGQREFERRGELERELLASVNHVIGRTDWDKAHTEAINPEGEYHYCGETLRDSFYGKRWEYAKCESYSIFVSQASYPIKGLHMLLKAMPLVLRKYPKAKVYVAGVDPTRLPWYRITGYGKYLKRLISELKLEDVVEFTGMLSEEQMCERYLKSNLFVCCSAIENSPNSLGEAQLLGMPYLTSYVGGAPEIVDNNPEVMYRFEEYEMLAEKVCKAFETEAYYRPHQIDIDRYSGDKNVDLLKSIYMTIGK